MEMEIELVTEAEALERPAGRARDDPNTNPTLDPPKSALLSCFASSVQTVGSLAWRGGGFYTSVLWGGGTLSGFIAPSQRQLWIKQLCPRHTRPRASYHHARKGDWGQLSACNHVVVAKTVTRNLFRGCLLTSVSFLTFPLSFPVSKWLFKST